MEFGSVCSGIDAASVAWNPIGWKAKFFSEIEKFPCAVLKHHYPSVVNRGDMTRYKEWPHESIGLIAGGTPCQSFSVAGLRKGMDDPRGNLALGFLAITDKYRPEWLVWENVPGVISSLSHLAPNPRRPEDQLGVRGGGQVETEDVYTSEELHALNCFLAGLSELGYGWAYRVLDAQYFGVPQRRRRIFVVGHLGNWRPAAAVLFERQSLQGNAPPGRKAWQGFAAAAPLGAKSGSGYRLDLDNETYVPETFRMRGFGDYEASASASALKQRDYKDATDLIVTGPVMANGKAAGSATQQDAEQGMLVTEPQIFDMRGRGEGDLSPTLMTDHASRPYDYCPVVTQPIIFNDQGGQRMDINEDGLVGTLRSETKGHAPVVAIPINTQIATRCEQMGEGTGLGIGKDGDPAYTITGTHEHAVAFSGRNRGAEPSKGREERPPLTMVDKVGAMDTVKPWNVQQGMRVRRLTPRECERLQGFPDDYTLIPYGGISRKKLAEDYIKYLMRNGLLSREECYARAADGPRYKAIGNSWAVPVARWIGERIQKVDDILKGAKA